MRDLIVSQRDCWHERAEWMWISKSRWNSMCIRVFVLEVLL